MGANRSQNFTESAVRKEDPPADTLNLSAVVWGERLCLQGPRGEETLLWGKWGVPHKEGLSMSVDVGWRARQGPDQGCSGDTKMLTPAPE